MKKKKTFDEIPPPIVNYVQPNSVCAASNGPSLVRSIRQARTNTQIRSNMHKYKQSQNTDSELLEYEQTPKAVQVHATHEYIHLPVLALI